MWAFTGVEELIWLKIKENCDICLNFNDKEGFLNYKTPDKCGHCLQDLAATQIKQINKNHTYLRISI